MKQYSLLIILILQTSLAAGQYLSNPSFEGPPGIGICPPQWLPFDSGSTPDTEPLDCDHFTASEGETYITLVARGSGATENPNSIENCQATLLQALEAGLCYSFHMDLASRDDVGHYVFGEGFIFYTAAVKLKVYGSNSSSERGELLLETDPILNTQWERVSVTLKPQAALNYLTFEVELSEASSSNGNILIDNLVIDDLLVSTVMLNETYYVSDLPVALEASGGSSYSWSPASGLSCYDCRSPQVNSSVSTTYTCTIWSSLTGCPTNELFILSFINDPDPNDSIPPPRPEEFKIPNVFTPNGDRINDNFEITGLPPYSSLRIFDRSGKEVFSSEQYNSEWDGRDMDNNPLPSDTYWYVLITPGLSGEYKGYVYLKRE